MFGNAGAGKVVGGILAVVAGLALASCSAPTLSTVPKTFSLHFTFPSGQVGPGRPVTGSRIILPSAASLKVEMLPSDARFDTRTTTVAIPAGASSVTAGFSVVETGTWTVTAIATDSGGTPILAATSTIDIGDSTTSAALYLVPVSTTTMAATSSAPTLLGPQTIAQGASYSWTLPSAALKADGSFELWLDPTTTGAAGLTEYLQSPSGASAASQWIGSGAGSYVTLYNGGTSTATAQLIVNPLRVSYDANGGSGAVPIDTNGYLAGASFTPASPGGLSKAGYSFTGWTTAADGTGTQYLAGTAAALPAVAGPVVLYAHWTNLPTYLVTYDANGGVGAPIDSNSYLSGATATAASPASMTYPGYTFTGWNTAANGSGTPYAAGATFSMGSTNVTLYAQWSLDTYTISYSLGVGTNSGGNATSYNVTMLPITLAAPTQAYYTFAGWYSDAGFTTPVTQIPAGSTGNLTFYAKWAPITYTISYVLNGGINSGANPASYDITTPTITLAAPTQAYYTFAGWYSDAGFTTAVTQIPTGSTGIRTLYAKWTPITYTITYSLGVGTSAGGNPTSYNVTTPTITLAAPTQAGYTFGGWYSDAAFTTAVTQIATGSTGNLTLYAKWTPITYTISYVLNGGTNSGANPASYDITTPTISLAPPSQTGYNFAGWYSDAGFTAAATQIPTGNTGNLTFYAKWIGIATVTLSFQISPVTPLSIAFSPSTITVYQGGTASISCGDATLSTSGINWQWSIDGVPVVGATTASFTFTPATQCLNPVGQHTIYLKVQYNGVWYSGDVVATVTQ